MITATLLALSLGQAPQPVPPARIHPHVQRTFFFRGRSRTVSTQCWSPSSTYVSRSISTHHGGIQAQVDANSRAILRMQLQSIRDKVDNRFLAIESRLDNIEEAIAQHHPDDSGSTQTAALMGELRGTLQSLNSRLMALESKP